MLNMISFLSKLLSSLLIGLGAFVVANIEHQHIGPLPSLEQFLGDLPCPDYTHYAIQRHKPFSNGSLELPFQRPHERCRKFKSSKVETVIKDLYSEFKDPDLAHLFQNAFPNTLDTTVLWHTKGHKSSESQKHKHHNGMDWRGTHSFIVTGDINAEWLRDSTNQLKQYQNLAKSAPEISDLLLGAIATQAEFVIANPYCNAFQPPGPSKLRPSHNGQDDRVYPTYEPTEVFECKYELDSLANFLSLGNQFYAAAGNTSFLTERWFKALQTVMAVIESQSESTFTADHRYKPNEYTFQRWTNAGTETLNLHGIGNPLGNSTGLIRSAFRPSDDASILGFLIPSNAMMSVELKRTSELLKKHAATVSNAIQRDSFEQYAERLSQRSQSIKDGIYSHAVVSHRKFGKVFAYEVDGYGSHLLMDDANVPSLLSLPLLGFLDASDEIYQNTRRMVLSSEGNPYYLTGRHFHGIGGPHIGLKNAWPMSVLVQALTSTDDEEILECLERVKRVSIFGLINESVDVRTGPLSYGSGMTRSWFAWANSVFAQTVLHLVEHKPHLILKSKKKYIMGKGFI